MIITKIKLKNIRSYEDAEVEFPTGSVVLSGDIGSGKTTILLAIEFALFGLQPGQKGSALLRNGSDEGSVILEMEIDARKIIIERGLKKGKTVNQSFSKITIDGKCEETSITELKNKILEVLNYPKEFAKKTNLLYRFTVYTPQEEMKQIILENSETRLDTLRHIFGIDKYKKIRENTELFTAKLRENIREYLGQIRDFEDLKKKLEDKTLSIKKLEESLVLTRKELAERKELRIKAEIQNKEVEDKIKEKEKYERESDKMRVMLMGKSELIANIENEKNLILRQIEDARKILFNPQDIQSLEQDIKNHEKLHEEKNKVYFTLLSKIHSEESRILDAEKLKDQISSLRLCPTCFQDVADDYKINIIRKFNDDVQKAKKEIIGVVTERDIVVSELEKINQFVKISRKKLEDLRLLKIKLENVQEKETKLEELEKQKIANEKDVSLLEKQVGILRDSASLLKKYDLIYEQNKKEIEHLLRNEREKELEIASSEREIQVTTRIVEDINKEIAGKELIKVKLLEMQELEDWLSSSFVEIISFTEKNIMLKLREEFSKLFNEWFNTLVPENFSVRLDEEFTPVIEQHDFSLDYSFLSGGERTAIALAYRLALNQVINSLLSKIKTRSIVILDEPTDGFSEQQLDKMRDVLAQLKSEQLIIVSHESKIESFVENIIKFKKEDGVTRIEK